MHVTKTGICQVDGIDTLEFEEKTKSSSNL